MRRLVLLVPLLAGCPDFDLMVHERDLASRGLTEEDLTGPPMESEIRARIINDIRSDRVLAGRLDEGSPHCPENVLLAGSGANCRRHDRPMSVVTVRSDSAERQHPVSETAYYCAEDNVYYYHYVGGRDRLDVWMGPFPTRLRKAREE